MMWKTHCIRLTAEKISKLEDITIETIQNEMEKVETEKKKKDSVIDLWDDSSVIQVYLEPISREERRNNNTTWRNNG